jgi:uncharacterized protein YkwD
MTVREQRLARACRGRKPFGDDCPFNLRRSHLMHRTLPIIALTALALAACAGGDLPSQPSFYQNLAAPNAEVDATAAQSMISGYRQNNGLGPVAVDPALMRLASEQSRAMAQRDKLDHNAARSFTDRITSAGFPAKAAVENVGAGYHTLAEAFSGWRDSPPHRANMLKPGVTRMGIAAVYAPNSKYKVFWTLIMAAPDREG